MCDSGQQGHPENQIILRKLYDDEKKKKSMQLKFNVGHDGILRLQLPVDMPNQEIEMVIYSISHKEKRIAIYTCNINDRSFFRKNRKANFSNTLISRCISSHYFYPDVRIVCLIILSCNMIYCSNRRAIFSFLICTIRQASAIGCKNKELINLYIVMGTKSRCKICWKWIVQLKIS